MKALFLYRFFSAVTLSAFQILLKHNFSFETDNNKFQHNSGIILVSQTQPPFTDLLLLLSNPFCQHPTPTPTYLSLFTLSKEFCCIGA